MPKSKARKKSTSRNSMSRDTGRAALAQSSALDASSAKRVPVQSVLARPGLQSLFTAALVALGCWGFAFSFAFLTSDPNRYLYGGMAALLAVMWSINFVVRLRRWQRGR